MLLLLIKFIDGFVLSSNLIIDTSHDVVPVFFFLRVVKMYFIREHNTLSEASLYRVASDHLSLALYFRIFRGCRDKTPQEAGMASHWDDCIMTCIVCGVGSHFRRPPHWATATKCSPHWVCAHKAHSRVISSFCTGRPPCDPRTC